MFKNCKVIKLPTYDLIHKAKYVTECIKSFDLGYIDDFHNANTKGNLSYSFYLAGSEYMDWDKEHYKKHHLYITSNDKIKAGDCIYNVEVGVVKCLTVEKNDTEEERFNYEFETKDAKCWLMDFFGISYKVIASTDKSLNLPQPSIDFIDEYCKLGGVEDIEVEYEKFLESDEGKIYKHVQLKTTKDNTIIIKDKKQNYTREEVKNLFDKLWKTAIIDPSIKHEAYLTWINDNI